MFNISLYKNTSKPLLTKLILWQKPWLAIHSLASKLLKKLKSHPRYLSAGATSWSWRCRGGCRQCHPPTSTALAASACWTRWGTLSPCPRAVSRRVTSSRTRSTPLPRGSRSSTAPAPGDRHGEVRYSCTPIRAVARGAGGTFAPGPPQRCEWEGQNF